jgi:hypothetical protein
VGRFAAGGAAIQIAAIVGDAHKELYNGLIPPLGALFRW